MMCQPFRPSAGAAALCRKILLRRGAPSALADVLIILSAPLVPASSRRRRGARSALADVFNYHQCAASAGVVSPAPPCRLFSVLFFPFPPFAPPNVFAARLRKCRPAARLSIFYPATPYLLRLAPLEFGVPLRREAHGTADAVTFSCARRAVLLRAARERRSPPSSRRLRSRFRMAREPAWSPPRWLRGVACFLGL